MHIHWIISNFEIFVCTDKIDIIVIKTYFNNGTSKIEKNLKKMRKPNKWGECSINGMVEKRLKTSLSNNKKTLKNKNKRPSMSLTKLKIFP